MKHPSPQRYNSVAISLHWLIALLILGLLASGFIMGELENSAFKYKIFQLHKSFGITVLGLSLLRLAWRLLTPVPALPDGKTWEIWLARAVRLGFYVLMIGMPLVGWLGVSTSPLKIPTVLFGLVPLPNLPFFQDVPEAAKQFFELHETMAFIMIGLLCLHLGAAVKHHFLFKNDVLLRMAPLWTHGVLRALRGQSSVS